MTAAGEAVIWHDVECAGYRADLPLWHELAGDAGGPVLDLGCGSGRVALHLAALGHDVWALDCDPELVEALTVRARERGLRVRAHPGDARSFELDARFALAIAPMQVVQLLGGRDGRRAALESVRRHLDRGGVFAVALADPFDGASGDAVLPPLPDVLERDGWVFSSMPVALRAEDGATAIDRVRQAVSPGGELSESFATIRLDAVTADELERDAAALGYRPAGRRSVAPAGDYVGSTIVLLEAA